MLAAFCLADPWLWTEQQVCQWLSWATNEFSLANVNFHQFLMNGQDLCNLGKERFLELAPDYVGDILWEHLEQMIKGSYRARKSFCFKAFLTETEMELFQRLLHYEGLLLHV